MTTAAETEMRIQAAERLLAGGCFTWAATAALATDAGISRRQAQRLVARAQERLRAHWVGVEREEMLALLFSQLETLQIEARRDRQYGVAVACLRLTAALAKL